MNFLIRALSEADGTPSSTRVNLLILMIFTLNLIAVAFWMAGKLPEVPASLADLIKFLFGVATSKVVFDSLTGAITAFSSRSAQPGKSE